MSSPSGVTVGVEDAHGGAATSLIAEMCAELSRRYQRPPSPFLPEEASGPRAAFVVARLNGGPVGCGALRRIDDQTVEIKRMYVVPTARRCGIARRMLAELERCATRSGYGRVILETGRFQPEALALYHSAGYDPTDAYGRHVGNPDAFCFEKRLPAPPFPDAP